MKTNLKSIILVAAAAAVIAGAIGCIARLELRARRLENRLAAVEAALYAAPKTPALVTLPSKNGAAPLIWRPQLISPGQQGDTLENRVEKIEQAMSPHLEFLPLAKPGAPRMER